MLNEHEPFSWVIKNSDKEDPLYTFPIPGVGPSQLLKVTANGNTVLHFAALGQAPNMLNYILGYYPQLINIQNLNGETPLHWSCRGGLLENVKILIKHGGNILIADKNENFPFFCAAEGGNYELVKYLLELHDIGFINAHRKNLLNAACEEGNIDIIKLLVTNGANSNDLFYNYCSKNEKEIVKALSINSNSITRWAVNSNHLQVAKMMKRLHL